MTAERVPLPEVRRHPLLGALAGLLVGVGVAALSVLHGVAALGTRTPPVVVVVLVLAGLTWVGSGPIRVVASADTPPTPEYNQRIQEALADNEAAIDEARRPPQPPAPEIPDLRPADDDDRTDWHGRPRPPSDPGHRT
ncbi:MAG: hypothetical protein U5R31_06515 [Acidimicrobiia bacterium]|nr:hypothetical protein [Acidimicrobiia bacterium]